MAPPDRPKTLNVPNESAEPLEKERKIRTFIRERTLFGREVEDDLLKKPPLDVVIDLGNDSKDFLHRTGEVEAKSFERFVKGFGENFGVSEDKILADPKFRGDFLKYKDLELNTRKRRANRLRYLNLRDRVNLKLVGFVGEKNENALKYCNSYIKLEKDRQVAEKISSLAVDTTDLGKLELVEAWRTDLQKLNDEYREGKIAEEEYLAKRDAINEKAVVESGDEDLKELWNDYKNDEIELAEDSTPSVPSKPTENLVSNKDQAEEAFSDVDGSEFYLDIHDNGTATVAVGREKFPMEIVLYKDTETNKYVYYIFDKYADNGFVRTDTDLNGVLDQRYLDSYISSKIGAVVGEPHVPFEVADHECLLLVESLVGRGKDRGYRIDGENREVLDKFISILASKDAKYLTYNAKIEALNIFFEEKDNVSAARRAILTGKVSTVSDLLGDKA